MSVQRPAMPFQIFYAAVDLQAFGDWYRGRDLKIKSAFVIDFAHFRICEVEISRLGFKSWVKFCLLSLCFVGGTGSCLIRKPLSKEGCKDKRCQDPFSFEIKHKYFPFSNHHRHSLFPIMILIFKGSDCD